MPSIVLTLLLVPGLAFAARPPAVTVPAAQLAAVNAFVKTQLTEGVSEPEGTRQYVTGRAAHRSPALLVVRYTLEQGNNWTLHLAAFQVEPLKYIAHSQVGGKGRRSVDLHSVTGNVIEVETLYYADSDARCCPSVGGHSTLDVLEGSIEEEDTRVHRGPTPAGPKRSKQGAR